MRITRILRHPIAVVLAAIAVLATPALLFAHARLVKSTPAANAALDTAPTTVSLWFSERPEPRFTSVQLLDSASAQIPLGAPTGIAENGLSFAINRPLTPGSYTIVWRTAASDGHATNGKFAFRVNGAQPLAAPATQTPGVTVVPVAPTPPPQAAMTPPALRWAELVGVLLMIGAIVFRLGVVTQAGWPDDAIRDAAKRARRCALVALVVFAGATLVRVGLQSQLLAGAGAGSSITAMLDVARDTRWGHGWFIGTVGALVVLFGLVLASTRGWFLAALGAVLICVSEALTGHAAALRHTPLAIAADVTHVLGAGAWMGTLAMMAIVGMPVLGQMSSAEAPRAGWSLARSFHTAAVDGVVLVVASGVIAAFLRLPTFSALWTTDYGSWLFRKLVFVLVALAFGAYHWRRFVTPEWTNDTGRRFARNALGELIVGVIIVAFTSMLISTQVPQ